jgi:hypothetical protein
VLLCGGSSSTKLGCSLEQPKKAIWIFKGFLTTTSDQILLTSMTPGFKAWIGLIRVWGLGWASCPDPNRGQQPQQCFPFSSLICVIVESITTHNTIKPGSMKYWDWTFSRLRITQIEISGSNHIGYYFSLDYISAYLNSSSNEGWRIFSFYV